MMRGYFDRMMRPRDLIKTTDGGFVIPESATVKVDGRDLTARAFLRGLAEGTIVGGNIVRHIDGEVGVETFPRKP